MMLPQQKFIDLIDSAISIVFKKYSHSVFPFPFHPNVSISLSEQFHYVSDEEQMKELLADNKGKRNVLFCFVKGLGMKGEIPQLNTVARNMLFQKISIPH